MLSNSEEVEVTWYYRTKQYYIDNGYKFTKFGDKFKVKIEDLHEIATVRVNIKCDYCEKVFDRRYCDHIRIKNKELEIEKDSCIKCKDLKKRELLEIRHDKGLISKYDNGYWTIKENRLKELDSYIKSHNFLDGISNDKEGNMIAQNFYKNNHSLLDGVIELGYEPRNTFNRMPEGYYDDFNILKNLIEKFINNYEKFPTVAEMKSEFRFDTRHISKFGGIDKIKDKLGYIDDKDLVDDNGFYNRSTYEYFTSQYLIHNNIIYKREQYPFPSNEGKFRSDFTLCPIKGKEVHVEVWGMESDKQYLATKIKKLDLYKKYNIPLISIGQSVFAGKTLDKTQEILYELFSQYLNIEYKTIDKCYLIAPNSLTDEELFDTLMNLSVDGKTLPTTTYLNENKLGGLYNQVVKRFNNYASFAKKFNIKNTHKRYYWTPEEVRNQLDIVVKLNKKDISRKSFEEIGLSGLLTAIENDTGMMQGRINYYLNNDVEFIHEKDLKILKNIVSNKGTNIMNKVTPQQQEQAKQILDKYNSKLLTPTP